MKTKTLIVRQVSDFFSTTYASTLRGGLYLVKWRSLEFVLLSLFQIQVVFKFAFQISNSTSITNETEFHNNIWPTKAAAQAINLKSASNLQVIFAKYNTANVQIFYICVCSSQCCPKQAKLQLEDWLSSQNIYSK